MPAITTAICGVPLTLSAPTQNLIDLFADYFRYYPTRSADALPAVTTPLNQPSPALKIELKLKNSLPPREQMIPPQAKLFSQSGQVSLWRETRRTTEGPAVERFYFHLGSACFHVEPHLGRAIGTVTPHTLAEPQILANTYTLFALLLMLRARGLYHLHAAAAVTPRDKLCLICGPQHAGKSTFVTALGLAGWRPVSDDSLIIGAHAGRASLTAFKKHFHLADRLLAEWPELAGVNRRHQYLDRSCVDGLKFFRTGELADAGFQRIDYVVLPEITPTAVSRLALWANSRM